MIKKKVVKKTKWYKLDPKKHGVAGLSRFPAPRKKEDKRATSWEGYGVVFFPQYKIGFNAAVGFHGTEKTLSQTAEAARVRFADGIGGKGSPDEKWKTYHHAGHRVRKIKIIDMGPA